MTLLPRIVADAVAEGWFNVSSPYSGEWRGEPPGGNGGCRVEMWRSPIPSEVYTFAQEILKALVASRPAGLEPKQYAEEAYIQARALLAVVENPR